MPAKRTTQKRSGITNAPLNVENENQRRVPRRGTAKEGTGTKRNATGPGGRAKSAGRRAPADTSNGDTAGSRTTRRSVKGGKTSGSRAGLRASRKGKSRR
jgi:hypothetical protein